MRTGVVGAIVLCVFYNTFIEDDLFPATETRMTASVLKQDPYTCVWSCLVPCILQERRKETKNDGSLSRLFSRRYVFIEGRPTIEAISEVDVCQLQVSDGFLWMYDTLLLRKNSVLTGFFSDL